jgi:cyclopropane-fatty-acyl-phospholipid synthase
MDIEAAQREKYAAIARLLDLRRGETLLEIGCGWGGFAEYAAREHGVRVRALTISDAQYAHASARIAQAGLAERVEVLKQDYRVASGSYDKIASIEMLEAVGEENWPVYFGQLHKLLRPGGCAAVQVITIADEHFASYRRRADFIQRCVFPGGMLPSMSALRAQTDRAGLAWGVANAYAEDYAQTLLQWLARFDAKGLEIERLGYDARFLRLWRFYLAYCVAGFRSGRTDLIQFSLTRQY